MSQIAISSWSVDGLLTSGLALIDLPAALAAHGITTLELCHFHLPSTESAYLAELRAALAASSITLYSVLIDAGDIASPDDDQRGADLALNTFYIDVAAALGAERVRVCAGRQPATPETIARSAAGMRGLVEYATTRGVQVSTENWLATAIEADALLAIHTAVGPELGICADTGNAEQTADKYTTLQQIAPLATSAHIKARTTADGSIDTDDLGRCARILRDADFDRPVSLIFDKKVDEWQGLARLRAAVEPLFRAGTA